MAKKGQKFCKYPKELKQKILDLHNKKYVTIKTLSKQYNVPIPTLRSWISKSRKNMDIYSDNRGKFTRKYFSREDLEEQISILKKFQAFLKAQHEKK